MQIKINKPGLLSTVQDMGRHGFLSQGVPVSGPMDTLSARIANIALGNNENDAVLEFTDAGAEFTAESDILIAYSGDGAILKANAFTLPADRPVFIPENTTITLSPNPSGYRTYLAIAGGWDVPEVLGSRSTYLPAKFGGFKGRALKANDKLNSTRIISIVTQHILKGLINEGIHYPKWSVARESFLPANKFTISVMKAGETDWFDVNSLKSFFSASYSVSVNSNRMACRLDGPCVALKKKRELLSTGVTAGTIQVSHEGEPIILMADGQTTGGYPRIGQVAATHLPLCAQLRPGQSIKFYEIGWDEAIKQYLHLMQQLREVETTIKNKFGDL